MFAQVGMAMHLVCMSWGWDGKGGNRLRLWLGATSKVKQLDKQLQLFDYNYKQDGKAK